jgi:autotransporter-associated beta strand protein
MSTPVAIAHRWVRAAVAVAALAAAPASAQTWNGQGGDPNVTTSGNWIGGSAPPFSGGTSTLTFATGGASAVLDTSLDLARLVFNATPPFTISRTSTNTLTLQGESVGGVNTGITAAVPWLTGSGTYTLSAPVILNADQSWNVANSSGTTTLLVSGPISGSGRSLTKIGNGVLALAGANTYTGTAAINAGTLELRSGASLVGPVAVGSAGTLRFGNGPASTVSIAGPISGAGSLAVTGGGAAQLIGANTSFTGSMSITAGELAITASAGLGTGPSAIVVVGNSTNSEGGSTVGGQLAFVSGDGFTFARNLELSGQGLRNRGDLTDGQTRFYSLRSTGNNVVSGSVGLSNASVGSSFGTLELSGAFTSASTGTAALLGGAGNIVVSGPVTMPSGLLTIRGGARLTNATNSIAGGIRLEGGSLEIANASVLGGASIRTQTVGNDAILRIRTSAGNAAGFGTANVQFFGIQDFSTNNNRVFLDNARGGSDLNQTVALRVGSVGSSNADNNAAFSLSGGHGYGLTITGTSGGTISFGWSRNFTYASTSNGVLTIDADTSQPMNATFGYAVNSTGDIAVNGSFRVSGGTDRSFTKGNSGRTVMSGTQGNLAGGNFLNEGTLQIRGLGALASSTINIGSTTFAATLDYIGPVSSGTGETWNRAINLAGTTGGAYLYASQSGTSALVINGPITASGSGTKTFVLGGSATGDNAITTSIPTSGSSTLMSLQKIGVGTWVLSGNNTFTGTTTISGGVLKLQSAAGRDTLPNAAPLVFGVDAFTNSAAGTLSFLGENDAASTETTGTLTASAGAATITAGGSGTGSAALTFANLGTRSIGATVNFVPGTNGSFLFGTGVSNTPGGILVPAYVFSGTTWATVTSSTVVGGLSTFTDVASAGSTIVDGSTTNIRINSAGSGANVALGAATTSVNTLLQATATPATIDTAAKTLRAGGVMIASGQEALTIGAAASSGTLTTSSTGTGDLVLWNQSANALTVNAVIANITSGTSGLTKSGTGLLVLGGANTFTGNTTINEGTVRLSGGAATLGAISLAANKTTIRQAGTLDLNAVGGSTGVTIGMLDGSGLVTNSTTGTATLVLGRSGTTTGTGYFTGLITDGGTAALTRQIAVTKSGSSTSIQYLTGANTYTGPTRISSGTLGVTTLANIGAASGIGAGDPTSADTNAASLVFDGGTLLYTGNNGIVWQPTQTPSVSIDRLFTLAGNGRIDSTGMYGDNDFSNAGGSLSRNSATLILSNTGVVRIVGTGARTLTLGGDVNTDYRFHMVYDNQIALLLADGTNSGNTLSVTKAGGTLWKLTNTGNAYSGTTTVSAGFLEVGDDSSGSTRTLSSNSNLSLAGGRLVSSGTFARAAGAGANQVQLTGGASSGFAAGSGDLVVNLGSGTLSWGSGNFNVGTLWLNSPTSQGTVTFASPIDLNGATRTISVDNNLNSTFDYAIVSGIISGSGGLTKSGADATYASPATQTLRLSGQNTYTGTTTISQGPLVVETIGNSASASSNLGAGSAAVLLSGANSSSLNYIGTGETSNRQIRVTGSTTGASINSNGSGPLVLTNFGVSGTGGTTTITLGGDYPGANEIRSNLAVSSGTLNITLANASTWTLSGSNTLGSVTINAGAVLGIGSNSALNASATLTNAQYTLAQIAAIGGPRTLGNNFSLGLSRYFGFTGENSIELTGTITVSDARAAMTNSIAGGVLSISGPVSMTAGAFNGSGQTILSGSLSGSTLNYNGSAGGSLTLSGSYAGNTTTSVNAQGLGPIIFSSSNAIPGTGAILSVNAAGRTLAAGYAIDQAFLTRISSTTASFAVGLAADSSNNLDFSSGGRNLTAASLGAVGPDTRVYSGTLTPIGTVSSGTYRLGGGGGTLDFRGPLTGASSTLTVGGDVTGLGGTVILSSATNSYGGATTVQRGILQVASLANAGSNSSTGTSATINLSSGTSVGTLRYVGSGHASNRTVSIQGTVGGIVDASGSGALDMTSGTISAAAGTTVWLTGSSTATNTIGFISSGSNVIKTGPGTWQLLGASTYTGQLQVLDGTIVVGATVASSSGASPFGNPNSNVLPIVGNSAAGITGTAAMLAIGGIQVNRGLSIATLGPGASQVAVLGMTGTGTAIFGGSRVISVGRDLTLQASNGGTAEFNSTWAGTSGTAGPEPVVAFTVGSANNAGTVRFGSDLPSTLTSVTVANGTAQLNNSGEIINSATPVTVGSTLGAATLDLNGLSQSLSRLTFAGNSGSVTTDGNAGGMLRLVNSGSVSVSGTGHVIASLVDLVAPTTFDTNSAATLTVSSVISSTSGAMGLTKAGAGTLRLSAANTYSGNTTVSEGTLVVNGGLGSGALSVAAAATLMGSGTIGGAATIAGIHSPGNSPGVESFLSDLTYTGTSSQVIWELWGNTDSAGDRGSVYDGINVNGNLDFTGATSLVLDFGGSGVGAVDWTDPFWGSDQTWTLFDVAGTTSNFGNFSLTNSPASWLDANGLAFASSTRKDNSFSVSQQGSDVLLRYTVVVPEPASLALAAIGIAAAAWAARRRAG